MQIVIIPTVLLILLWNFGAKLIDSELILPSFNTVFQRIMELCAIQDFRVALYYTMLRSVLGFLISFFCSVVLGFLCGFLPIAENMLKIPLSVIKATPVVSFILLALFWFQSNELPIFVSVLMTMPVMTIAITQGIRVVNPKLKDMCNVYKLTKTQKFFNLYLPSLLPYLFSSSLSAFGISWKVVVASEVLCLPKFAAGTELQKAKVHIETADVFAITLIIVFLSFLIETVFVKIIHRKQNG